MKRYLCR